MPRQTRTKSSEPAQVVVADPVVEQVVKQVVKPVVEQAVKPDTGKKSRKPKSSTEEVSASSSSSESVVKTMVEPVSLSEPAAESSVDKVVESVEVGQEVDVPLTEQSVEFLAKLQQLSTTISSLKLEFRTLEKKWARELRAAQKQSSKRKRKAGNRAPSGFVKPTRISDELAKFLEKASGSEMARTEVTRDINKYIRTQGLQDKDNGRKINPDGKLAALLKLKKTDELTYFNLQRYMSPHFAKSVKAETTTA